MKLLFNLVFFVVINNLVFCQTARDSAAFIERKAGFYNQILSEIEEFKTKPIKDKRKSFVAIIDTTNLPKRKEEFKYYWHNEPRNQGRTGTCWAFSGLSFFESEIARIYNKKIKLSEMFIAYWEYVEKARSFVETRGNTYIGEGSQLNAVYRIIKKYGIVPLEIFDGKLRGQKHYDHETMFDEISKFLENVKQTNMWNEALVENTVKSILNKYMGTPPEKFVYNGKTYTPKEYFEKEVKLDFSKYIDIMSFMKYPYYTFQIYDVPDNWNKDSSYLNLPLDDFMYVVDNAIKNGFTLGIGGDVSEPGLISDLEIAIIPTFDIPADYINEFARQFRFENSTSTDDHGVHLVGYLEKNGAKWYLIKDSGAGSFNGPNKGYFFYRHDFIKLKMLTLLVHVDALGKLKEKVVKLKEGR